MNTGWIILGWLAASLFGLLTVSMLLTENWLAALTLLLVTLLVFPPASNVLRKSFELTLAPPLRIVLIVALLVLFGWLLSGGGAEITSVYKSPAAEARLMAIYDEKMTEWPVPYEDLFLKTSYGTVHVIASGPVDAPPLLLLHASGVAAWSWKFNVAGLSENYRVYAIDLIGDVGKSAYDSFENTVRSHEEQANLYFEISEQLNAPRAVVVGASDGGFIASNYAQFYPERVEKLALLGPMGYAGANQAVVRIMFVQFFPLKPLQESTFRWAFSDSPQLEAEFGEWFRLVMTDYNPGARVRPTTLAPGERQEIQVPVLFIFGENDNLVGDPERARALVSDMARVQVAVVEAGHLMGGERPDEINDLVLSFFSSK